MRLLCAVELDCPELRSPRVSEKNPRSVGRITWLITKTRDFLLDSTGCRHYEQPPALTFRTENELRAVGRPIRLPVVRGIRGHLKRLPTVDWLHPEVEVS